MHVFLFLLSPFPLDRKSIKNTTKPTKKREKTAEKPRFFQFFLFDER
jgi:hypothetical protein